MFLVNENKKGKCIPFVSDYTDCTEETLCSGCIRCSCTANSEWTCNTVHECKDTDYILDDRELDSGFNTIAAAGLDEKKRDNTLGLNPFVNENDRLLEDEKAMDDEIMKIMRRSKRSVANEHVDDHHGHIDGLVNEHVTAGSHNGTVRFYHTVDELNEDTLMNVNTSGTVHAKKVAPLHLPKLTRRTGLFDNINNHNITAMDSLHIEYNQPKVYAHHITDNKIDTATQVDHHIDGHKAKFDILSSNVTQKLKDDILSKIVVNELKTGVETIGDAKGPVMSNITFTPENDTLTAMAFIAGNLLNKLWNMEKTANDESVETDRLKHEKIADLLDLFKDPLTLRQESFLKDALSKLSDALDKTHDLSNVTLCEKIEQTKNSLNKTQPCEKTIETPTTTTKQPEVKIKIARKTRKNADSSKVAVVSKIKYVMDLIKKFEKVKKQINKLQPVEHTSQESVVYSENPQIKDVFEREHISKDDMSNMNVFGTVLEKITKLLVPKKDSKKPLNKIRKLNVFRDDDYVLNKLKDTFGIDIGKISLSVKDKLLLDYLTGPQSSKCTLAEEEQKVKAMEKVEGDILLNLSEFFKIKSFTDLFNLMHPQKNSRKRNNIIQVSTTTESPQPVLESIYQPNLPKKIINTIANAENKDRFTDKKEKLKKHLKTLLDDLVDLQKEKGISPKDRKLRIADALPCIYNVLNFDKDIQKDLDKIKSKYVVANNSNTVSDILNHFKTELKFASSPTRRSNQYIPEKRPRSAIVWERAVKNALNKTGVATRRMEILKVKNFKELKKSMSDIEGHSKTYKAKALVNVPVQSRLMLLRTLQMEATNYIQVLTDIQQSLADIEKLPPNDRQEVVEFVNNAASTIKLSDRISKEYERPKARRRISEYSFHEKFLKNQSLQDLILQPVQSNQQSYQREVTPAESEQTIPKLQRKQIVSQLIRNRMIFYKRLKEEKAINLDNDINYKIAKRVLHSLDVGNYELAKNLFKVFVVRRQQETSSTTESYTDVQLPNTIMARKIFYAQKEPLIQFETRRSGKNQLFRPDSLRQLINVKSL